MAAEASSGTPGQGSEPVARADPEPTATAGEHVPPFVDQSGTWKLDKDKSDSMEPFLRAAGAPWIVRKMAGSLQMKLTIRHSATIFDFDQATALFTMKNRMVIGKESEFTGGDGSKAPMMTSVLAGGAIELRGPFAKDKTKTMIMTSTLDPADPHILHRTLVLSDASGKELARVCIQFSRVVTK